MALINGLKELEGSIRNIGKNFSGGILDDMNDRLNSFYNTFNGWAQFTNRKYNEINTIIEKYEKCFPKNMDGLDEEKLDIESDVDNNQPYNIPSDLNKYNYDPNESNLSPSSIPTIKVSNPNLNAPTTITSSSNLNSPSSNNQFSNSNISGFVKTSEPLRGYSKNKYQVNSQIIHFNSSCETETVDMQKKYKEAFDCYYNTMMPAIKKLICISDNKNELLNKFVSAQKLLSDLNDKSSKNSHYKPQCLNTDSLKNLKECKKDIGEKIQDLGKLKNDFVSIIKEASHSLDAIEKQFWWCFGWTKIRRNKLYAIEKQVNDINNEVKRLIQEDENLNKRISTLETNQKSFEEIRGKQENISQKLVELNKVYNNIPLTKKDDFSLKQNQNTGLYEIAPSIDNVEKDIELLFKEKLEELKDSANNILNLQKPTEALTKADLNKTSAFPSFITVGICSLNYCDTVYDMPMITRFPFPFSRCFDNKSEIAPFLLRLLCALPLGSIQFTIIDHESFGSNGSVFNELNSKTFRLITQNDDFSIRNVLREHKNYISEIVQSRMFNSEIKTWADYNSKNSKNPLPCKILVIYSFKGWTSEEVSDFIDIVTHGASKGVFVIFAKEGLKELNESLREKIDEEKLELRQNPVAISKWLQQQTNTSLKLETKPMVMPSGNIVPEICKEYVNRLAELLAKPTNVFMDLFNGVTAWSGSSREVLSATIGWDDSGNPVDFTIGKDNHHTIIAGKSGGGKTNLIHVIICSLCHKYSPDELQICLLDMKNGVEANRYVDKSNPENIHSWLPHAYSILGSKSPHFASSVLDKIIEEETNRNEQFKLDGATTIAEWKVKTGKKLPRILVVIDEFTQIFQNSDTATSIAKKLEDLLSEGRYAGIHILLATQDTDKLNTSNASTILRQTSLRFALPGAKGVLLHGDDVANTLKIPQAIINEFGGAEGENIIFKLPFFNNEFKDENLRHQKIYRDNIEKIKQDNQHTLTYSHSECKIIDGFSLKQIPSKEEFTKLLGPEPSGSRPRFNLLLGRDDDFDEKPFKVQLCRDNGVGHLMIVAPKDPKKFKGVWSGLRNSILASLALLSPKDKYILYYNPISEDPFSMPLGFENCSNGFEGLNAEADENCLLEKLRALQSSKAKHKVLIVENFDQASFLGREDKDPYAEVDEDTIFGKLSSAFKQKNPAFTVILLMRNHEVAEKILGDENWDSISHHIAFGFEASSKLNEVIKGTNILENINDYMFYSSSSTGGGYRTFLPFVDVSSKSQI